MTTRRTVGVKLDASDAIPKKRHRAALIALKVGVRALGRVVTLRRARRGFVRFAALGAFVGVRIVALRAVVVAMTEAPVRAESHVTEGARVVVLAAAHRAAPADIGPGSRDLTSVATINVAVEAHVLRRDREILLAVSTDAHAVRCSFRTREGPACVKIMILCRLGQIFDAGSSQQPQLLWSRMSLISLAHLGHSFALS